MADVKIAIDAVLREEDAKLSGVTTNVPGDNGGRTRWGIAERSHPELTSTGFFDSMDRTTSLVVAERVYEQAYAAPLKIALIPDQQLANAILSFGVNAGVHTAATTLQQAACLYGVHVECDGVIGPSTLSAVEQINPTSLLRSFCARARAYYQMLADLHPEDQKFVRGWMNRTDSWLEGISQHA